jgi:hypothetical protein
LATAARIFLNCESVTGTSPGRNKPMNAKCDAGLKILLLVLMAGCGPRAKVPPAVQAAAGKTAWGLNGSFRPELTNGQVLTGRVQFVVAPYSKDRWHSVAISVDDDDEDLTVNAEFPSGATNAVVVEIDTAQFPPGSHTLTLGGEIAVVHNVFTWVRGKTDETEPLPSRSWTVVFITGP